MTATAADRQPHADTAVRVWRPGRVDYDRALAWQHARSAALA